jgi:hypothetical protein
LSDNLFNGCATSLIPVRKNVGKWKHPRGLLNFGVLRFKLKGDNQIDSGDPGPLKPQGNIVTVDRRWGGPNTGGRTPQFGHPIEWTLMILAVRL